MNRKDMVTAVANHTGYSRNVVNDVLKSIVTHIKLALYQGEKVKLYGFGTFEPKVRAARTGRNPNTGETVFIPERIMPVFIAGQKLKDLVCYQRKE